METIGKRSVMSQKADRNQYDKMDMFFSGGSTVNRTETEDGQVTGKVGELHREQDGERYKSN